MQELQNQQFLRKLSEGNPVAFDELYVRYRAWLVVVSITILKDEMVAEEIVQDFFLKAWKEQIFCQSEFPSLEQLKGYLYKYVKNLSFNKLRSEIYRRKRLEEIMIPANHIIMTNDFDLKLSQIEGALHYLSPKERITFELAFFHQLTRKEIAARLNVSINTVKTQLLFSVRKLREKLNNSVNSNTDDY
ncbi:hypothetical protein COR50_18365 [Chitinophaga caeni]|uniref:RNA polymerase sigma factor 70 region 4 type 2 domain-containing protein n=1 Tax=Chitinophaga caeni TaxID=2029983 RepID=A0A291QYF9_9BACT|nr:sigma-70 family RNA polymerase sigma factor [Chitinophaga caeni]ATL48975.1 hypothetical protein COR50_18365 [Chitinophaga caeni]